MTVNGLLKILNRANFQTVATADPFCAGIMYRNYPELTYSPEAQYAQVRVTGADFRAELNRYRAENDGYSFGAVSDLITFVRCGAELFVDVDGALLSVTVPPPARCFAAHQLVEKALYTFITQNWGKYAYAFENGTWVATQK